MESVLFALVLGFCSPVECQEFVLGTSMTEDDCHKMAMLADGLYEPIPNRVLYSHYRDSMGADNIRGYPDIVDSEIKCVMEY